MVALESMALGLAKTIIQKAAGAWIADRRTAEERKKELTALLTSKFRHASPEQRFLDEATSELASFSHEFRGLDDGDRVAALLAVGDAFERADLTDRALFAVDVDAAKLARRLRAGQPRAKTVAGLGEVGSAFYDEALDRCCHLYVRAVLQVPAFVGRSSAEILSRLSGLPDQVAARLSDLPDQVAARVINAGREYQAAVVDGGVTVAGRPLEEMTDPFVLEMHRPVQLDDAPPGLPVLPPYVPREHDEVLGQVVRAAADGRSGIAVLVGGSSTGKTRACWEALQLLRNQDSPWRLWHPIDPSRPDAALRELAAVGPRTVVWLNEAQFYLAVAEGGLGERVAAGLRELLRDPARRPVLVLATLWPEYWHGLTTRPAGDDPHSQARELLVGHDITVPDKFTPAQLQQLAQARDARLTQAAVAAQDGQVIQFLAGAPELLARYRNAPPAAKALIHAAMDARRLGTGVGLPQAFLEAAAPGYLTGDQWDALGEDWLEQALAYTAVPCKGARGPLTCIRPRPARSSTTGSGARDSGEQIADGPASTPDGPLYRLADYLDQHGRTERNGQFPPAGFWAAAADHAFPADQAALGNAAHARGLYRDAAQLHKNAAARVSLDEPGGKGWLLDGLKQASRPELVTALADRAAACFPLGDPFGVAFLLGRLRLAGAHEQVTALADRAAACFPLGDPFGVAFLLGRLRLAGAHEQVTMLLRRDPAAHVCLDDLRGVADLLEALREAGAGEQVTALLRRDPAAHVPLDDPVGVASLLEALREAGAEEQVTALLRRDPAAHAPLENLRGVAFLLKAVREAGADEQGTALAVRAAARAPLDNPVNVNWLLKALREAGADEQGTALAARAAACFPLDDPYPVALLLRGLWEAGAQEQATALLRRDPAAHVPLDDPFGVASLLDALREAGADDQVTALAARVSLDKPGDVARLLYALREAGADEQVTALLRRDPAARAPLDNPDGVAFLLQALREAGAPEQVTMLAARAAARAPLDNPRGVFDLLKALREAGADEQVTALLRRDPAARAPLDNPDGVAFLLYALREAGADEQVTALLRRDPAARAPLENLRSVAMLLQALREAGADEQVTALLRRDPAAHVPLDDPGDVDWLLRMLRDAGAHEQVTALAERLPGAGMFELFRRQEGHKDRFRFGRETDGSPAKPWGWGDLD